MNYRQRRGQEERRSRWVFGITLAVCAAVTLVYLQSRLWVVDLSYHFSALQKQVQQLQNDNARLRLEVARLRAPERIEKLAHDRLGLRADGDAVQTVSARADRVERDE